MAKNIELVTKEYVDAIENNIQSSEVGQKTPNGGEIFSTYEGDNENKALGEASATFGQNNIAGCLGFKVSNFVKGTTTPFVGAKITLDTDDEHFANIAVGDKCSVRINYNMTGIEITAIDSATKTVTLSNTLQIFPDFVASENNYLWLVDKPNAGDTPIGIGALAGGIKGNQAHQDGSLAFGRDNIADGRWSTVFGSDNKAGYNTFVVGKNNTVIDTCEGSNVLGYNNKGENLYLTNIIGENNNIEHAGSSFIAGLGNKVENGSYINNSTIIGSGNYTNDGHSYGGITLIGQALVPKRNYQTILGKYNEENGEYVFAVGFGEDESTRKSTLTVFGDGSAEVYAQKDSNKAIVQKQYVDNKTTTLQNGITANESLIQQEIDDRKAGDEALQTSVNNKLDKVTDTSTNPRLYMVDIAGNQGTVSYAQSATAETIMQRDTDGRAKVAAPQADNDITNKKYVDDTIASQVASVYKPKGSVADLSSLPTPDKAHEGFVYNIESEFTTTDNFVEGAGKTFPAGTNVVIVNTTGTTYKYDVLAGMVDLSSYATKTELSGKVDKVTSPYKVYVTGSDGSQKSLSYTESATSNTIAYRRTGGTLDVGTPTIDANATPKSYVDNADALKMNKSAFDYNETTKTLTIDIF